MPSPCREQFLQEVLLRIKFRRDRAAIRSELEAHIADRADYYAAQGDDEAQAERRAIDAMGDPIRLGVELNRQHSPLVGWVWQITNKLVGVFVVLNALVLGMGLSSMTSLDNPLAEIPVSEIVYQVDVDETVKLDDTVIHFTHIVYERNQTLHIIYEQFDASLRGARGMDLVGHISDNLGNTYVDGTGSAPTGWRARCQRTVTGFSSRAEMLIITSAGYNRAYQVKIALPGGSKSE